MKGVIHTRGLTDKNSGGAALIFINNQTLLFTN
jgi:hypothetical protein